MIEFNINNYVWIKLTEKGEQIRKDNHNTLYGENASKYEMIKHEKNNEGFERWQLWELMQEFGSAMWNGCAVPFETIIKLEIGNADRSN